MCDPLGASEISDACKPLKKRSRASTDVEMASSQYRDTSDSDSRGLNDPQVGLETMQRYIHKPKEENTVYPPHRIQHASEEKVKVYSHCLPLKHVMQSKPSPRLSSFIFSSVQSVD